MNEIIVTFNDEKIITSLLHIDLLKTIKDENYKIFGSSLEICIGENIDCYDDEGNRYPNSILQEKGLLELKENEVLDGQIIREKTEIEKYNENPSSDENIMKVLDIDIQGNPYIRERTMIEKYNDALISKDKYNAWISEQRENEYSHTSDKLNLKLLFDTSLSEIEKEQLQKDIENKKSDIRKMHPKVLPTQ